MSTKNIALIVILSTFCSTVALIATEQKENTLKSVILPFLKSDCGEVENDQVITVVEYLQNNPDIKHKYSEDIKDIIKIAGHKSLFFATQSVDTNKDDTKRAKALTYCENCHFVWKEFRKLTEEK